MIKNNIQLHVFNKNNYEKRFVRREFKRTENSMCQINGRHHLDHCDFFHRVTHSNYLDWFGSEIGTNC